MHETRNVRALCRNRCWGNETIDNSQLVEQPELGLMVGYQSVDVAASDFQSPKAISGKGAGAERAIDEAQGSLFALPEWEPDTHVEVPINSGLWHFCVSVDRKSTRLNSSH